MKHSRNDVAAVLFAVLSLPCSGLAAASSPNLVQINDFSATAQFFTGGPDLCLAISMLVTAHDREEIGGPAAGFHSEASILINAFDICTHSTLIIGNGTADGVDFGGDDGALRSARLSATVPVLNLANGGILDVQVDLSWTADGNPSAIAGSGVNAFGKPMTFRNVQRSAVAVGAVTAVAGSVPPELIGINLAPEPSIFGSVAKELQNVVITAHP
jgi:hypothetical protein